MNKHETTDTADEHDPVCGMQVQEATAAGRATHEGHTYLFCSSSCLERFTEEPESFLGNATPKSPSHGAAQDAVYICPMHPEVKQVGPGTCPICGMALEPKSPSKESDDSELSDMQRRFVVAACLTLPVVIIAMGDMVLPGSPIHSYVRNPGPSPQ